MFLLIQDYDPIHISITADTVYSVIHDTLNTWVQRKPLKLTEVS